MDYGAYARGKARRKLAHGFGNTRGAAQAPSASRPDTQVWGSVCLDGIVVAASGANPWFDEAFAAAVASLFKAAVQGRREAMQVR